LVIEIIGGWLVVAGYAGHTQASVVAGWLLSILSVIEWVATLASYSQYFGHVGWKHAGYWLKAASLVTGC